MAAHAQPLDQRITADALDGRLAGVLIVARYQFCVWPPHRALPWSATEVHELALTDGFLPDFSYQLKARIPPDALDASIQELGLTGHGVEVLPSPARPEAVWGPTFASNPWWDPPEGLGQHWRQESRDFRVEAWYHDGWLYVSASEW